MEFASIIISSLSLLLSVAAFSFTYSRTETMKRRLRIELNRVADDAHHFLAHLSSVGVSPDILKRYESLNHSVTLLLSIDKDIAAEWIRKNKPETEWATWETILQVSMKKYRTLRKPKEDGN